MKRTCYNILIWLLAAIAVLSIHAVPVLAESPVPQIPDATPAIIGSYTSPSSPTAAVPTYYDKGSVNEFDGTPDQTGNSAGEIVFMIVIVLVCLFFVVEAVIGWIRKRSRR